jgi:hypothetical protein
LLATFDLFCGGNPRGANVEHGLAVTATTGFLVGALFLVLLLVLFLAHSEVWRWRYLIAGACVLEAAAVAVAIAFVALDSATYVSTDCGFMGPTSDEVRHMGWLYYAWGFAIVALLYQAVRILRYVPPEPARPESEPGWLHIEEPTDGRATGGDEGSSPS